ncbi:RNA polymerase sigma factor [Frigoribacterium sp. Leaf8]|jgi:RNA polymerase sigma factor (sigma-70 family)|uniref:RNA polymerase sigma factor n=1 Tax=Frigoribacterium sp. Leaf8 TaxID=1735673 RepID=UPI001F2ECFCC|nr:RNA polymerase sigma factor [Frigoribacterium sp. Leaf8]
MQGDQGAPNLQARDSDAALWLAAVSGSDSAFAKLFDRHRLRVFRKALLRTENVQDAEDVVAAVFFEAWRNRKKVRIVDDSILPWLLTVTVNVALNLNRSKRRYRRLLALLPPPEDTVEVAQAVDGYLDGQAVRSRLISSLKGLSAIDQSIVELALVEELPLAAVAAALDLPIGTVKSKLHRARKKLQSNLGSLPQSNSTGHELNALDGQL